MDQNELVERMVDKYRKRIMKKAAEGKLVKAEDRRYGYRVPTWVPAEKSHRYKELREIVDKSVEARGSALAVMNSAKKELDQMFKDVGV